MQIYEYFKRAVEFFIFLQPKCFCHEISSWNVAGRDTKSCISTWFT